MATEAAHAERGGEAIHSFLCICTSNPSRRTEHAVAACAAALFGLGEDSCGNNKSTKEVQGT